MSLLIDGYNLLHATDLFGSGELAGTLEGSREALLAFLANRLTSKERRQTTIVFDAAGAPPGLPDRLKYEGISVRYARGYADADSLLEELIEGWRGVKSLTVVSSDHRVQRAARRRGAKYTDSEPWHAQLSRRRQADSAPGQSQVPVEDASFWVEQFTDESLQAEVDQQDARLKKLPATKRSKKSSPNEPPDPPARQPFGEGILDPFPEGYADDLAKKLDPPREEDSD